MRYGTLFDTLLIMFVLCTLFHRTIYFLFFIIMSCINSILTVTSASESLDCGSSENCQIPLESTLRLAHILSDKLLSAERDR